MALAVADGVNFSAMRAGDRADDEESEASSLHLETGASGNAIKAFEDAFQFRRGNADAAIGDAQRDVFIVGGASMRTETSTWSREYFTALSSKLETAVRNSAGSPRSMTGAALAETGSKCRTPGAR